MGFLVCRREHYISASHAEHRDASHQERPSGSDGGAAANRGPAAVIFPRLNRSIRKPCCRIRSPKSDSRTGVSPAEPRSRPRREPNELTGAGSCRAVTNALNNWELVGTSHVGADFTVES